jgi:hypothetical protein
MANTTRRNWQMPLERTERDLSIDQDQASAQGASVSWGGIWAGVLVALGTLLLLSTLGLAVGIAANAGAGVNAPGGTPGTVGAAAVIWSALALLISMFIGGLASTRMGRIWDRGTGMFQGGLVWVITLGAILYLGVRGLGMMSSTSMGFGDAASSAANAAAEHPGATTGIGWSPFIVAALSLLAALAGAASGLRRLFDDSSRSTGSSRLYDDTNRSSTTTTTTTTRNDQDRY